MDTELLVDRTAAEAIQRLTLPRGQFAAGRSDVVVGGASARDRHGGRDGA